MQQKACPDFGEVLSDWQELTASFGSV